VRAREQLIEQLHAWTKPRADIRAVTHIGSTARAETPADEWSDVDFAPSEDRHPSGTQPAGVSPKW
jgi:hypothetical protein